MALPFTDTFLQTSGSTQALTTYSAAWSILEGGFNVPSGTGVLYSTGSTYNTARDNSNTYAADHRSRVQLTAAGISGSWYVGPAVRCQSGANTSYHCESNGSSLYFSKCVAGTQTTLAGPISVSLAGTDWLSLSVEGVGATVTLKAWSSAAGSPDTYTQIGSDVTDTASDRITTAGQAGIFAYGSSADGAIADFQGENIGGGGGGGTQPPRSMNQYRHRRA